MIDNARLIHIPDRLLDVCPQSADPRRSGVVSYLGAPLLDVDGKILGHTAVIDRRPIPANERVIQIFQIFAARAAAELQRLRCWAITGLLDLSKTCLIDRAARIKLF